MKAATSVLCSFAFIIIVFATASFSFAALYDVGDGTILQIRDDGNKLLWMQDANFAETQTFGVSGIATNGTMNISTAFEWIGAMNTASYLGYSDWRLPAVIQPDPDCSSVNGAGQDFGYYCTASEMANLFNIEFERDVYYNSAPFVNFNSGNYLTGTLYEPNPSLGYWYYSFADNQNCCVTSGTYSVMAVRDCPTCTVPVVPEPISSTLFIVGGATLGFRRFRKQFKK